MTDARINKVDVELLALLAGLKPALRQTVEPAEAAATVTRFGGLGLSVTVRAWTPPGMRELRVLYVAPTARVADALAQAEAASLARQISTAVTVESCRNVGRQLGYPSCCIESFVERLAHGRSGDFAAAQDAWVAAPRRWLNNLLFDVRLLTFEPCRYDCAPALAYAETLLGVLGAQDAQHAEALDRSLGRDVVVAPHDARAIVELNPGRTSIAAASAPHGARNDAPRRVDEFLAVRLAGVSVQPDGKVVADQGWGALLVGFGADGTRHVDSRRSSETPS